MLKWDLRLVKKCSVYIHALFLGHHTRISKLPKEKSSCWFGLWNWSSPLQFDWLLIRPVVVLGFNALNFRWYLKSSPPSLTDGICTHLLQLLSAIEYYLFSLRNEMIWAKIKSFVNVLALRIAESLPSLLVRYNKTSLVLRGL